MRWVLIAVGVIFAIAVIAALAQGGDDDSSESYTRSETRAEENQRYYNGYLGVARQQLRDTGGDIYCQPDYWELVSSQVEGAGAGQEALIQLAMADACKEAGELSEVARFSKYYADAP